MMTDAASRSSGAIVRASAITIDDLGGGIRRQILGFGETIMTCRIWFDTGAVGSVHRHPHAQTTYIETGRFSCRVGDTICEVGAGDCVFIAPDTDHGLTCIEAGSVIDNFSPMRADFLSPGEA